MTKTVGVLGGGQLGRMLTEAANRLNIPIAILDAEKSPAKQINVNGDHVTGSFANADDIQKLAAKKCDVLTIEIEHVDTKALENLDVSVQPSADTISLIQDKYAQKEHLIKKGIEVARSLPIGSEENRGGSDEVKGVVEKLGGYPVMLKARKDAYDGRGNFTLKSEEQIPEALQALGDRALYAEQWAKFRMELAVMVVKIDEKDGSDWKKTTLAYPTVETVHEDSICKLVYAPPRGVNAETSQQAQELARRAIAQFKGRGIFGVEMFLLEDGRLLVNEIAPRPHNSGHYTIEACPVSQYEAHLRAILELPLCAEDLEADRPAIMLNLLGTADPKSHLTTADAALKIPRASVHLYGKGDGRPKRKMGHVTITGSSIDQIERRIAPLISLADGSRSASTTDLEDPNPESLQPFGGSKTPVVLVTMGSDSDLKVLKPGIDLLKEYGIPHRVTITSAHRTPDRMFEVAEKAESEGIKVIIAAAGGAAHLPGMLASKYLLPVVGVPVRGSGDGKDALASIVQMPPGCPVGCMAINNSKNAALYAMKILATGDKATRQLVEKFEIRQRDEVLAKAEKLEKLGADGYAAA